MLGTNTKECRSRYSLSSEMNDYRVKGMISRIRRMAVHDGPGIRTVVFLKGCPLRCMWCAAPETQSNNKELLFYAEYCVSCNHCVEVCPEDLINVSQADQRTIDRNRCTLCGNCVEACCSGALRIIGEEKTAHDVLKEVERDEVFYQHSDGGVTISGGEPLYQVEFTKALLSLCKSAGFHTALETSGYQSWTLFSQALN